MGPSGGALESPNRLLRKGAILPSRSPRAGPACRNGSERSRAEELAQEHVVN